MTIENHAKASQILRKLAEMFELIKTLDDTVCVKIYASGLTSKSISIENISGDYIYDELISAATAEAVTLIKKSCQERINQLQEEFKEL